MWALMFVRDNVILASAGEGGEEISGGADQHA